MRLLQVNILISSFFFLFCETLVLQKIMLNYENIYIYIIDYIRDLLFSAYFQYSLFCFKLTYRFGLIAYLIRNIVNYHIHRQKLRQNILLLSAIVSKTKITSEFNIIQAIKTIDNSYLNLLSNIPYLEPLPSKDIIYHIILSHYSFNICLHHAISKPLYSNTQSLLG